MNNPLLARFDGQEIMAPESSAAQVTTLLNGIVAHELASVVMSTEFASDGEFWTELGERTTKLIRPYAVRDGVLQIPVKGVLLKDFPYQFFGLATGYEYIRMAFDRGLADPAVSGIAMIFDTPGGMVSGNFDLVDHIYASRGVKPIAGFASEHAYSAGYSTISAVDPGRVNVARTGGVGSIGVVTSHVDYSKAMEKAGVKVTFIHAGKHKVEGNPYEALSDEAKGRIQKRIDNLYSIFVSTVARNRGLDEKAVRATEALTFSASDAVSNGLADNIGSLEDAIAAFAADLSKEDETMTKQDTAAVDQAALDNARTEGHSAGVKEGATAERARITSILDSAEGKARPAAAMAAAIDTDMSVEQATKFLGKLPEEKPAAAAVADPKAPKGKEGAAADFTETMNNAEHPGVGASAAPDEATVRRSRMRAAAGGAMTLRQVK